MMRPAVPSRAGLFRPASLGLPVGHPCYATLPAAGSCLPSCLVLLSTCRGRPAGLSGWGLKVLRMGRSGGGPPARDGFGAVLVSAGGSAVGVAATSGPASVPQSLVV